MTQRIDALIGQVLSACAPWAREKDGRMQFFDPLDGREISAHYGASHAAAAFILWAGETGDEALLRLGETLLLSVLDRWDSSRALPGTHSLLQASIIARNSDTKLIWLIVFFLSFLFLYEILDRHLSGQNHAPSSGILSAFTAFPHRAQ